MDVSSTATAGLTGSQWKQEMLQGTANKTEQADQLAQEFEGILIRQYLTEALKPMSKDSGFFGGKASPMYQQLITDTLASSMTKSGSLGFSTVLQAQLFSDGPAPTTKGDNSHE